MIIKRLCTLSLVFAAVLAAVITPGLAKAEEKEHPGIYLRHIIYFPNLTAAREAVKDTSTDKSFKEVNEFPDVAKSPVHNRSLIEDVSEHFPMPNTRYLSYFGRGMTDKEREEVQSYKTAVLYDFQFPLSIRDESILSISQITLGIATKHGGYIWDSETRELFTPQEWKRYRVASWVGDVPNVKLNTVIHAYQDGESFRAITLGLAKFGVPDLVVNDFDWEDSRSISSLINLTSQQIVEQGLDSFEFSLDINRLKESSFKESLVESLFENAIDINGIELKESKAQEGDPNNFLLEFEFDQYEGKTRYQKQSTLLQSLFGWKDEVAYVKHNAMIEAASQAAKEKLPELQKRFNAGLDTGEGISLKAPFETASGSNEWMWVEVKEWNNAAIKGILRNIPRDVPSLKQGDPVIIDQKDVFDYIFYNKDGTSDGNKTGELIQKFQQR